jgi:hypothetical protein
MAASAAQMKKETAKTTKTPKAPLTDAERRKRFGEQSTRILSSLERSARKAERIMKKHNASEAQLEAFRKGVETLTARISRAAKGEASSGGFVVPTE